MTEISDNYAYITVLVENNNNTQYIIIGYLVNKIFQMQFFFISNLIYRNRDLIRWSAIYVTHLVNLNSGK